MNVIVLLIGLGLFLGWGFFLIIVFKIGGCLVN